MHTGINDNAHRDMEWCGTVIEFPPSGKPTLLHVFNATHHLLVKIFGQVSLSSTVLKLSCVHSLAGGSVMCIKCLHIHWKFRILMELQQAEAKAAAAQEKERVTNERLNQTLSRMAVMEAQVYVALWK